MPTYIYIFDDLKIFTKKPKYTFLKQETRKCPILEEIKKYTICNKLQYTEYMVKMLSIEQKVEILKIEEGLNIIFNEKGIGIIESFYQLIPKNIEEIYKTLINYKKKNPLIFMLE